MFLARARIERGLFLNESHRYRAARQRLQPERAGAREKIDDPCPGNIVLENAHPRFADSIKSWANGGTGWRFDSASHATCRRRFASPVRCSDIMSAMFA